MQRPYRVLRLWEWLVLVATVSLVGIGIFTLIYPGRRDGLPEYPQAINIVHTITDNGPDPFFAQTVTFQTSDSPETILAFYQTLRPIQPKYSCRVSEQTATMLEISCQSFKPDGAIFHKDYRISVTTVNPHTRSVQVEESGGATHVFDP
jgi:hypothetical protein